MLDKRQTPAGVLPGDLVFYPVTPRSSLVSRLIAVFQLLRGEGSMTRQYDHVAIVDVDTAYDISARWPRAGRAAIQWEKQPEFYRVDDALWTQRQAAVAWAADHVGQRYDLGRFFLGMFRVRDANICTTFAAEAWSSAGVTLRSGAGRLLTPNELAESAVLTRVVQ